MSGSVRGLIVTSGLLPQQEVRYGLYSTINRIMVTIPYYISCPLSQVVRFHVPLYVPKQ